MTTEADLLLIPDLQASLAKIESRLDLLEAILVNLGPVLALTAVKCSVCSLRPGTYASTCPRHICPYRLTASP